MVLANRQLLLMDWGWKFHKGDVAAGPGLGREEITTGSKAESGQGPARRLYGDVDWETVRLPHDWVVAEAFDPAMPDTHHSKPRGVGWYRRAFRLDADQAGRRAVLIFDGVATHAQVWVNGRLVARHFNGYTGFYADITDCLLYGETENVVSVRVDATQFEGWWYEGAGIYRHVWLVLTDPVCVDTWGVWVNPRRENAELGLWRVPIETTLYNGRAAEAGVSIISTIEAPEGRIVAQAESTAEVPPRGTVAVQQTMNVRHPVLWSLERPSLYTLRTQVLSDGTPVDDQETPFGFRTIAFSADQGFLLNDVPVKLKGTCNHQDHAGLGVALPDRVHAHRIQRLITMGSNAYRSAHNPPAPEILTACDGLGMLVMDENRWFSSSAEGLADLEAMVRRDRNHPSVILWSLFNEEPLQGTENGRRTAETMRACVRALDDSRPTTGAMNNGFLSEGAADALDVIGINYNLDKYDAVRARYPGKPIVASESAAASTTRGMYSREGGYIPAYDHKEYSFGSGVRDAWQAVAGRPDVMGTFLWTGFEYRGEERWPVVQSQSGMLDTCGFAKDNAYLCLALWTTEPPMVHILPHWNWSGREGEPIEIWCYSNCESVELYFNGESLGEQLVDPYNPPVWHVPYDRGVLQALGKRGGVTVAQDFSETTGGPAALALVPSTPLLRADGEDVCLVEVSTMDLDGTYVPTATSLVRFTLQGDGEILGVGNGDPRSHEADVPPPGTVPQRHLFNGKCQVIVRAGFEAGELVLTAEAEGLAPASLRLLMAVVERRPYVPEAELVWRLEHWWMTAPAQEPLALEALPELVMSGAVTRVAPGQTFLEGAGHAVVGTLSRVPEGEGAGLALVFEGLRGAAEVLVLSSEGRGIGATTLGSAVKAGQGEGSLRVDLSNLPGDTERVAVVVRLHGEVAGAGLTGPVRWEYGQEEKGGARHG